MSERTLDMGPWSIKRGSRSVRVDHPVIAAPMAGGMDPPYRMLLHDLGCPLSFTEMLSARALYQNAERTKKLFSWLPDRGFSGAQIFGADTHYLAFAASEMERAGYDIIDLNAGCPKRKVYRTGAGSAMLKDPDNLIRCAGSILDAVKVPVGVKMRMGFRHLEEEMLKGLVKDLEGIGLSYVAMHPRTMVQQYSGKADRDLISRMSGWIDIPLIASGDVRSPSDVKEYIERGAAAVMVARGLLGDPTWIKRCINALEGGQWEERYPVSVEQVRDHLALLRRHLDNAVYWYGEERGAIEFRPHFGWYLKRFKGRREYRDKMYSLRTKAETLEMIDQVERDWSGSFHDD
ncbi:MAG: tRNA dihydrouridine synthase [Thermoplasmatota archaeon]